jgi:type II secretory pathway predicted ATPase ExeA
MKLGALAALDQRIGLRYTMPPMTPEETGSYLRHHLALAGRSDTLFSDDATALIHQTSRGYPRAVNNLALQATGRRVRRGQEHRRRVQRPHRRDGGDDRMTTKPTA